jgi:hypothetical protein
MMKQIFRFAGDRRSPVAAVLLGAAIALAGCGYAARTVNTNEPVPTTGVKPAADIKPVISNKRLAQLDAAHLIALARLPKGSQLFTKAPKGWPSVLRSPAGVPGTPYLATAPRWAIVPGSRDAVIAWIAAHAPAGSSSNMSGSFGDTGGITALTQGFAWPSTKVLDQRELVVEAATLGGDKTAVRIDSQVAYTPNRPAAERIPRNVDRVEVLVTLSTGHTHTYVVTKASSIRLLESVIDSLARPDFTMNPGGPCLCGPGANQRLVARFYVGTPKTPAVVITDWPMLAEMGTGNIGFTLGHRAEPVLEDGKWLIAKAVEHITGVHFAGVP